MEIKNKDAGYTIVQGAGADAELENYRVCFEKNGTDRDIKNLQWLHQQNLVNDNIIYYAMHDQVNVAAIYTAIPLVVTINGVKEKALQSIDTITDAAHRGKGLFPKLANRLFDDAAQKGFAFVYGFPNENSAPGFFKKLKWVSLGEAPFLLKPLRLSYFLKKLLKKKDNTPPASENFDYTVPSTVQLKSNTSIRKIDHFGKEYDMVWEKIATGIKVCVDRSSAYMNWRYVEKPGEQYSKYGIYIDDVLKGVVIFTIKNKHNGRIGYVMEMICDQQHPQSGIQLLKFVTRIFKKEKTDAALAWCFPHSFNYNDYKKAGYFDLPVKFRPQHLFLGARSFNASYTELLEKPASWYISYSDSDTV